MVLRAKWCKQNVTEPVVGSYSTPHWSKAQNKTADLIANFYVVTNNTEYNQGKCIEELMRAAVTDEECNLKHPLML